MRDRDELVEPKHGRIAHSEEWRDIPNYEGLYQASNVGNIRRLPATISTVRGPRPVPGRNMRTSPNKDGYPKVCLSKNGKRRTFYVHNLVLSAFVRPRANGEVACHNDGNPGNNQVGNLRWDKQSENVLDEVRHGTHAESRKTHCPQGHELDGENIDPGQYERYGKRRCLACMRAHGFIRGREQYKALFPKIAEIYYIAICNGHKARIDAHALLAAANEAEGDK